MAASILCIGEVHAQVPDSIMVALGPRAPGDKVRLLIREARTSRNGNPAVALEMAKMALDIARTNRMQSEEAASLATLGAIHHFIGDFQQAISFYHSALDILDKGNDRPALVSVLTGLGDIHFDLGDYDNSLMYYERIMKVSEDNDAKAIAINNIGNILQARGDDDRAVEYYLRAIGFEGRVQNRKPVYDAYENLAMILEGRGKIDVALRFYERALTMECEDGAVEDECITRLNLATLYLSMKDLDKAHTYAMEALHQARRIGAKPVELMAYRDLPPILEAKGDFRGAYDMQRRHSRLADTLFNAAMAQRVAEAQARFDFKNKNLQIEQLEREKSTLFWQIAVAVLVLVLLTVLVSLLYRSNRINKRDAILLEQLNNDLRIKNEELNKSERMLTTLNAGKDKLFSVLAHDLKTPFNSLMGFLQVLDLEFHRLDREDQKQYISNALQSATRLFNHVDSLLNWSRMQMGRMELIPEDLSVGVEVDAVFALLREDAERKSIDLRNEIELPVSVPADKSMLRSLIQNLVSNAIKFTPSGGWVSVDALRDADWVHLTVADNGIGMDESVRQSLFRLEGGRSTKGTNEEAGTGLGLMICAEIVEKHAGRIEVYSTPGNGTTFVVSLPTAERIGSDD